MSIISNGKSGSWGISSIVVSSIVGNGLTVEVAELRDAVDPRLEPDCRLDDPRLDLLVRELSILRPMGWSYREVSSTESVLLDCGGGVPVPNSPTILFFTCG